MIRYNKETQTIEVVTTFSWDATILPLILKAKEWYKDTLENDVDLSDEARDDIQKFIDWNPATDETLTGETKDDLMEYLQSEMTEDEWNDYTPDTSLLKNLRGWLSDSFFFEFNEGSIEFND